MDRQTLIEDWFAGTQAMQRIWKKQFYADLGAEKLSVGQLSILAYLQDNQPVSSKQIAADLYSSKSAVAQTLESLDKHNFIVRHDDPADRRVSYIGLSKAGSDTLLALKAKRKLYFKRLAEALSDDELRAASAIQQKILHQLQSRRLQEGTVHI